MLDRRRLLAAALAFAAPAAPARAQARLPVVASFSILADLLARVGGDRLDIRALVGPGGDAHAFAPAPADARRIAEARLVVVNGLGFEGWIDRLVKASGATPRLVTASDGVTPRRTEAGGHGHGHGRGHGNAHGADPHAWQDVRNVAIYVENVRKGLAAVDPAGAADYAAGAAAYAAELAALDADIRAAVAALPPARRKVVTTHDSFGYFAEAYGVAFLAPKGVAADAEPSPRDVARLIRQIRAEKIPALFLENIGDPRLMQRIAAETGARIGGTLYADSLSAPDGPAPSYVAMMRHNIRELTQALAA